MIHDAAAQGFAAGAATYAAGRPSYPAEIKAWLRNPLGLGAAKTVLDLGAGTGKFIPFLQATGARIIAVEPVDEMRQALAQDYPTVKALSGTATAIPLADASVDAVICAQAFHWFSSPESLAEFHRVLKPGGALGLVWNVRDERVDWVRALSEVMAPYEAGTPRYHSREWRRVFPSDLFEVPQKSVFVHGHTGPAETVIVNRILSVSFMAALPEAEQDKVAATIRQIIEDSPALANQPEVTFPYLTEAYFCKMSISATPTA